MSKTKLLMDRARIPENHRGCLLKNIPNGVEYKQKIVDYIENIKHHLAHGQGLYLWGEYGSGKTGLAAIICKAALSRGFVPLWVNAERIPSYMCEDIMFSEDTPMRDRMFSVDILVIDDYRIRDQRAAKSDWIERWLESVIRRRLDDKKVTIITSNTAPQQLAKLKAVFSISTEAMEFIEIEGHDFRSETAASKPQPE